MSVTAFAKGTDTANLSDPLVNILFSSKLHVETQSELFFNQAGLMKKEDGSEDTFERKADSPIIVKDEFGKERGQRIRLALRKQLSRGVGLTDRDDDSSGLAAANFGKTTMIDTEEQMNLLDMEVAVEQLKHAVGFATPEMQDLKTPFRMEQEAASALRDWLTGQYEESILDAFYDGNAAHVIRSDIATATAHPRKLWGGDATVQTDIAAADELTASVMRKLYETLRIANVNPIRINGKEMYVLLAHVYALTDLLEEDDIKNAYQNAYTRTSDGDNPLFNRADLIYEGIVVHEYNRIRIPSTTGNDEASTRQCIALGADAIMCGNASEPRLVRRKEDAYEDKYGVGIKQIFGCARADFYDINNNDKINQSSAQLNVWAAA